MSKIIKFGEDVEGYNVPVLNEREVRAAAGILFLATFTSLMFILFRGNFIPIKYVISFFLTDFLIRVLISPRFAPTLILARLIVHNQTPEYVGAAQKKFAWVIGIVLAATMFVFFIILNAYSVITGIICLICLIFLFFESVFGICLGCLFYPLFFKEKIQLCPGDVCEVKEKQDIQKTSPGQILTLLVFIACMFLTVYLMNDSFSKKPHALFGDGNTEEIK
ncbi:hypothetical protein Palpr_1347 [Paludibacter propionicigenes WB4]|uniref:DUF4395 domain-containing protein n=1 Tax=Paludibacter propionicigenes (strain DSM 17365 / JCM 13257 / WB4) TaxID=694427 RepID=E4T449_PALPW|nr:DUF4395 domain-containing protein [Paludibacter propionicigenes]ADQ79493.1 hypothetical protein Palpr_1347 [Paludibacter propionicigenes WB4]